MWTRHGDEIAAELKRRFLATEKGWPEILASWRRSVDVDGGEIFFSGGRAVSGAPIFMCPGHGSMHLDVPSLTLCRRPRRQGIYREGIGAPLSDGQPCLLAWCREGHGPYRYLHIMKGDGAPGHTWEWIAPDFTYAHPTWSPLTHEARARRFEVEALIRDVRDKGPGFAGTARTFAGPGRAPWFTRTWGGCLMRAARIRKAAARKFPAPAPALPVRCLFLGCQRAKGHAGLHAHGDGMEFGNNF